MIDDLNYKFNYIFDLLCDFIIFYSYYKVNGKSAEQAKILLFNLFGSCLNISNFLHTLILS